MFLTSSTRMLFLFCAFARNCLILPSRQIIWAGKTSFTPAAAKEARGYAFGICGSAGDEADPQHLCQASCTIAGRVPRRHKAVPEPPLGREKGEGTHSRGAARLDFSWRMPQCREDSGKENTGLGKGHGNQYI